MHWTNDTSKTHSSWKSNVSTWRGNGRKRAVFGQEASQNGRYVIDDRSDRSLVIYTAVVSRKVHTKNGLIVRCGLILSFFFFILEKWRLTVGSSAVKFEFLIDPLYVFLFVYVLSANIFTAVQKIDRECFYLLTCNS